VSRPDVHAAAAAQHSAELVRRGHAAVAEPYGHAAPTDRRYEIYREVLDD